MSRLGKLLIGLLGAWFIYFEFACLGWERWWAYTWRNNNYQWSTWFDWKGRCCNSPATFNANLFLVFHFVVQYKFEFMMFNANENEVSYLFEFQYILMMVESLDVKVIYVSGYF